MFKENPKMNNLVAEDKRELDPFSEFTLPLKVIGQAIAYPFFVLFHRLRKK